MKMNKVMEPFWTSAQGWQSLKLPAELQEFLKKRLLMLTDQKEDVERIHVRDYGIRENYLGYGLLFASELFRHFRTSGQSKTLLVYISLDDGSGLVDWPNDNQLLIWHGGGIIVDGEEWFDCTVHFHIEWDDPVQFSDPDDAEEFQQPVLFLDSKIDYPLFTC